MLAHKNRILKNVIQEMRVQQSPSFKSILRSKAHVKVTVTWVPAHSVGIIAKDIPL